MKSYIILVLTAAVGLDFVVANSVAKQTVADKDLLLSESNDSSTNHEEKFSNNSDIEQENIETSENGETIVEDSPNEGTVELDIVESIKSPIDPFDFKEAIDNQVGLKEVYNNNQFNLQEYVDTNLENEFELVKDGDYYYNDVVFKDPNEIMDTAAGFVPIPIFRKKQKQAPRRRYATRRYNRRPYASRRQYYFYPYYRYYRPSSLRYYYY
ncbi:uncharacterized protein LOC123872681 [Maniola jurtina]|uniref:uncharacterized protein LOC123872681 n=1 Tax=Maniola jurtina TaxID=191418 RepID=UPI001E686DBF|nr:uncharacterized protein LOC123872681 [Maniola jurtina]